MPTQPDTMFQEVEIDSNTGWIATDSTLSWALTPGKHTLKAVAAVTDNSQEVSDAVIFTVVSFLLPDDQPPSGEFN